MGGSSFFKRIDKQQPYQRKERHGLEGSGEMKLTDG
jgi:hypothetical protein